MRALLIDDHTLFTQSLQFLLEDLNPELECERAVSIAEAVARPGPFDFIVLDYVLPDSDGLLGLKRLLNVHEGAAIMFLSGEVRPDLVHEVVEAGAGGFVSKAADVDTLLEALGTMLAGGVYLPPDSISAHSQASPVAVDPLSTLSPRQRDCVLKLALGKPNKTIARELGLGESTVKTHISAAFKALGVSSRTEAAFKVSALKLRPSSGDLHTSPAPSVAPPPSAMGDGLIGMGCPA
jgi:two-component system, NarL family, nitrate/nitrite response regulator NarL